MWIKDRCEDCLWTQESDRLVENLQQPFYIKTQTLEKITNKPLKLFLPIHATLHI